MMFVHKLEFLLRKVGHFKLPAVTRVPPPWIKVTRVAGVRRALPLVIKSADGSVGRGLQKNLALRWDGGTQRSQRFRNIPRPAGDLRTMQVMDGQPAAGVW